MAFRKCSTHGWMATSEYTVSENGEPVCPICALDDDTPGALTGYKRDAKPPNGTLAKAQYNPRERFTDALREYHEKIGRS